MKNIHILPTDNKYSRLYFNVNDKEFQICEIEKPSTILKPNRHIYITSDEEIKEGDYCISGNDIYGPFEEVDIPTVKFVDKFKKIILTTDPRLAPDVQKIDDEFLEWFVKNPSCEEVEIINEQYTQNYHKDIWYNRHKIIIPKEEPFRHKVETIPAEEILANRSNAYEFIDFDKQETLNEVALEFAKDFHEMYETSNLGSMHFGFIEGVKWQAERSCNEEEVRDIAKQAFILGKDFGLIGTFNEWFETVKKK